VAARLVRAWTRVLWEARRYEVVVVNVDIDLSLVAAFALALSYLPGGPRVVVIAHSVRPLNRWGGESHYVSSGLLGRLLGRLYRRALSVVVHGERSRAAFEEAWPGGRVVVIPHGDEEMFLTGEPLGEATEPRALFFGVWRKVKGLPVLMEAFDLLAARRPEARLTIAGAPSPADLDPAPIEAWAKGHGDRVDLRAGYVELEDVPGLFGAARCVVCPYETAFQSGVVHVALTFGRALVASDVGDLPEGVGAAGLLVAPGDPQALADALERVLFEPGLAAQLGEEARARSADHASWGDVAERFEAALR
jgi:glycosyltransferase involved in cell wall biosynthesis